MGIGGGIGFTPLQGAVGAARCSTALKEGGSCSPAVTAGIVRAGSPHQAEQFSSFFYFLHQGRAFPSPLFPPRMCIPLPIPLPRPQPHASGSISHTKAQKKQNCREQKAPGSRVTALASQRSVFNAFLLFIAVGFWHPSRPWKHLGCWDFARAPGNHVKAEIFGFQ